MIAVETKPSVSWCLRCGHRYENGFPVCECAGDPPVDHDSADYRAWWRRVDDLRFFPSPEDRAAANREYLDAVECSGCGETRVDAASCDLSPTCGTRGCSCVVARIQSCDWTDGMYACADHTPSHRGCPECDPPERDDR